jgi:Protein of unknown function (DUF3558)
MLHASGEFASFSISAFMLDISSEIVRSENVMKTLSVTFVLALPFLLTACNWKNSSPSASAKTQPDSTAPAAPASSPQAIIPDPCKLITKEEAESILGEPVKGPEPNSLGGNRICDYKSVKLHGGIAPYSIHIALTPEKPQAWDLGKKMHTDAKEAHPVAGIGDDAFFLLDDLLVYAKGLDMNINVMKEIDKPDHMKVVQEAEKTVAQKVVPRL